MSYGIEIRDAAGRVIIGPDTFTVRLIDRFTVVAGQSTYARPKAKAGMFCAFQFTNGSTGLTPKGVVGDGVVTVGSLHPNGRFDAPVECLVMGYV